MKILPVSNNILVEQLKFDDEMKTESGLYIPQSSEMRPINYVKVHAVSEDCESIKVGMIIITDIHRAFQVVENNQRRYLVDVSEIKGIVQD